MPQTLSILQTQFKLTAFRPGQEAVIDTLLQGHSALAVFPTGGGKSLCYQLPALMLDGLTLVVSPLIALMKDQVDALTKLGIAAARLDSSLNKNQTQAIYQSINSGSLKLLYVSPERLKNERFVQRLQQVRISLLAIDEAHCISEWGHNFRPDYLKLAELAKTLNVERVLALTATATPDVAQDICRQFAIAPQYHIQTSFRRQNLCLQVTPCKSSERMQLLQQRLLQQAPDTATIVYVTLQNTAEQVAEALTASGLSAAHYHAGLKDEERERVQNNFMRGETNIVVATIAFGMGIDKSNIRAVYHYNLPKSIENYVQEIGRAGRDGLSSQCELFACTDDLRVLENFIYGDTPARESLRALLQELLNRETEFDISIYELAQRFDIRPLVLGTTLTYLELDGIIAATSPFYSEYKIQFLHAQEDIIASFAGERGSFLQQLFTQGQMGRKWLTLDMLTLEQRLQQPKLRVVKALDYLEEQGLIALGVSKLRQGYRQVKTANIDATLEKFVALFERREQTDIERIQQVVGYVNNSACLAVQLLDYFGERDKTACGICNHCLAAAAIAATVKPTKILPPERHALTETERKLIRSLRTEGHAVLSQPRQLARFLCGLPSPATTRSSLRKHASFGALAEVSFRDVLHALVSE
jgi:ATP-dependent DNA helicase RecQ